MSALPQDDISPVRQSRWVHAKNYGSITIPAHGVCEVFGNQSDINTGEETLHVGRPTAHGLPECVVNSFAPINPGEYGWVTKDLPAYVTGSSFLAGDMVGTKKNSFDLWKGYPGFMVFGDGPNGTYRVIDLWEPLARGTLGGSLLCTTEKVSLSASWVSRLSLEISDARNTFKLDGAFGSQVAIQWDGKGLDSDDEPKGCWIILQIEQPCSSSSSSSSVSSSSVSSSSSSGSSSSSVSSSSISSSSSSSSTSSTSSASCSGQCTDVEVVTNVQCVSGNIIVTKKTLRICGDNVCVELI